MFLDFYENFANRADVIALWLFGILFFAAFGLPVLSNRIDEIKAEHQATRELKKWRQKYSQEEINAAIGLARSINSFHRYR